MSHPLLSSYVRELHAQAARAQLRRHLLIGACIVTAAALAAVVAWFRV
jgi:hypothetical protein